MITLNSYKELNSQNMYKIRTNTLWSCVLPNVLYHKKVAVLFQSAAARDKMIKSNRLDRYFNKENFLITDRGIFSMNPNVVEKYVSFYTVQEMGKEKVDMFILHNRYEIVYAVKTDITTDCYYYQPKGEAK